MAGLIVEGPDGAGKTELVRKIQYCAFWPVVHLVQPGYPDIRQMFNLLGISPLIFDRFHLSSRIYGQILRGKPELSDHEVWMLEGLLKARAYKLIVCIVPLKVMLENNHKAAQLWDEVRNEDVLKRLRKAYLDEALRTPLEFRIYDYTIDSVEELIEWALEQRPEAPPGALGSPRPERWLVGEVPDPWLSQAMKALDWSWCDTALSAFESDKKSADLAYQYKKLGEPGLVIAIGKDAASRLKQLGLQFVEVPHSRDLTKAFSRT